MKYKHGRVISQWKNIEGKWYLKDQLGQGPSALQGRNLKVLSLHAYRINS